MGFVIPMGQHSYQTLKTIKVLYEDNYYVAFNKPPGLLVIPTPKKEKNTLIQIVNSRCLSSDVDHRLHPCHRLDRDTSGIIIFAKGKKHQQLLMQEFKERTVKKKYIALIHGKLRHKAGEIKGPVKDFTQRRYAKNAQAKFAITQYRVVVTKGSYSVVEIHPITGRTNQIRIHFCEIGHPLLGERKYAFARDYSIKFGRTALHASKIQWIHPVYHKTIEIQSPLPKDIQRFIENN